MRLLSTAVAEIGLRVLWLSHLVPFPPKSGALLRSYNLLRAVASRHDVDLVAFVQEPLLRTFYPTLSAALADCRSNLEPICRSVAFLPIEKLSRPWGQIRTVAETLLMKDGYMANWLRSAAAELKLKELCESGTYDVAHFDFEGLAQYRVLCRDTPVTLGHHNAESHMMLRRADNAKNVLGKWYFRQEGQRLARFERRIASQFAAHVTCSDLDSDRLRPIMPDARMVNIPNGVDVAYFFPQAIAERPHSLVFVSSMSWYPNVDAILFLLREIWPRVISEFPSAHLDVIGANPPASVRQSAESYTNVTLHGFVDDIRSLVGSASLYVCPVRDGGGTKLKVLDALAMGKCIVAHPIACEGIAVSPGRDVVFADTAEEFARSIGSLLRDSDTRRALGSSARELAVSHYSFASIGSDFTDLLENIAREAKQGAAGQGVSPLK